MEWKQFIASEHFLKNNLSNTWVKLLLLDKIFYVSMWRLALALEINSSPIPVIFG